MENQLLRNKYYLYITEFFSGMAIMAVELGASRLLAPYFSSSQIVWTIIIGTIMIAMALGNVSGGRSADRDPDPVKLYRRIIIAALWIAAIPLLGKYIIVGITGLLIVAVSTNFLIIAAFCACMVIFVYPLFLLGTVTPSLVKYTTDNLEDNGKVVGTLGAFNTIGSILGTFLPTFVTIPAVGTAVTFLIFSGTLLLIGILFFLFQKKGKKLIVTAVVFFTACSVFGNSDSFAFWEDDLTYEGESVYNYLQVKDSPERTILSTNVLFGVQSVYEKKDMLTSMYYDYALAAPAMSGSVADGKHASLLILGMGTGTYAAQCRRYYPGMSISGVEIDGKITELAKEYFRMPEDTPVTEYDGRAYLNVDQGMYDVIMVDAYQDITIPFQMSSREFFTLVREHLNPDGVMIVNMNLHTGDRGSINEYLQDSIASVFPEVYTVDVDGSTNRELFALQTAGGPEKLAAYADQAENRELANLLKRIGGHLAWYEGGSHIFTDDQAPVELMGMKAIDYMIREEIGYYKELYREKGLGGLLEEM